MQYKNPKSISKTKTIKKTNEITLIQLTPEFPEDHQPYWPKKVQDSSFRNRKPWRYSNSAILHSATFILL
jgi:hypothetical protein